MRKFLPSPFVILVTMIILLGIFFFIAEEVAPRSAENSRHDQRKDRWTEPVRVSGENIKLDCEDGMIPVTIVDTTYSRTFCSSMPKEDYPIGTGEETYELIGHYFPYEKLMEPILYDPETDPPLATTTCSAFMVTGGDADFIQAYKDKVLNGNTVNQIKYGNLTLNIDLTDLYESSHDDLVKLFSGKTLRLKVKPKSLAGKDAPYCYSFISIVSLEQ